MPRLPILTPFTCGPGRAAIFAVVLVWMVSVNCGTIVSRSAHVVPYLSPGPTIPKTQIYSGLLYDVTYLPFSILDLPISLIVDTVLLPYDILVAIFVPRRISSAARQRLAARDGTDLLASGEHLRLRYSKDQESLHLTHQLTNHRFELRLRHDHDVEAFLLLFVEPSDDLFRWPRTSPEYAEDLERVMDWRAGRKEP